MATQILSICLQPRGNHRGWLLGLTALRLSADVPRQPGKAAVWTWFPGGYILAVVGGGFCARYLPFGPGLRASTKSRGITDIQRGLSRFCPVAKKYKLFYYSILGKKYF